jgi:protein SCO1
MRRSTALLFAVSTALGSRALANPESQAAPAAPAAPDDEIAPPPATYKASKVTVDEHLGATVPLDARFRTQDGKQVTLGEVLAPAGNVLPTIVTFNYSDCPMLCSLQLNGLSTALPKIAKPGPPPPGAAKQDDVAFRVGGQFRIVTIDLEPTESLAKVSKMRDKYLARLPESQRAAARAGWTFLVAENSGDGTQIRRVAESVGFKYVYIPERAEWAHPAALIFLDATGAVTRYVYGIEFDTAMMRESLFRAGLKQSAAAVGFLNRCYHYDPDANSHARAGVLALRIGAAGFLVVFVSGLGLLMLRRHKRHLSGDVELKS